MDHVPGPFEALSPPRFGQARGGQGEGAARSRERQALPSERLRDDFVFGDDLDKMYNENPMRLDGDEAYKRALGGDTKPKALSTPPARRIDDRAPVGDAPSKKIGF